MRYWVIALAVLASIPACADSRFRITIMPRPDLPPGKGQCDIRLQVDNEVEITVRRDLVLVHTLSGEDARDDGSDCNTPLPDRDIRGFALQPVDSRSAIRVIQQPSARNDFAVVVRILDAAAGFGRYRFRLTWDSSASTAPPGTVADNPPLRQLNETSRPPVPDGFVWNNAITYRGRGAGESLLNEHSNEHSQRLTAVRVDIDLGGKIVVSFTPEQPRGIRGSPRPVLFNGSVMSREGSRIRADMVTEDHRLHGTMMLSVDDSQNVNSITMNATDGQEHLRLTWDRR
jgi:hypothetical protein